MATSLVLAPATLIGVLTGRLAAGLFSEDQFRTIIVVILIVTACALLISIF
jgi:uncharacterized membrane protein YfcA